MRNITKNRKAQVFSAVLVVAFLILVVTVFVQFALKADTIDVELGKTQVALLNTFNEGESVLLYIDMATKYSVQKSLYDLGDKGGYYDNLTCGSYAGYSLWNLGGKKCTPKEINSNLAEHIRLNINYGLTTNPTHFIPLHNYDFSIKSSLDFRKDVNEITGLTNAEAIDKLKILRKLEDAQRKLNSEYYKKGQWTNEVNKIDTEKRAIMSSIGLIPGPIPLNTVDDLFQLYTQLLEAKDSSTRDKINKQLLEKELQWLETRKANRAISINDKENNVDSLVSKRIVEIKGQLTESKTEYKVQEILFNKLEVVGLAQSDVDIPIYSEKVSIATELQLAEQTGADFLRSGNYIWPLKDSYKHKTLASCFGDRNCKKCSKYHKGVDIPVAKGTPVYSVANGTVASIGYGYNTVNINHGNGRSSRYIHNSRIVVKKGDKVIQGQVIAYSGGKGPNGQNQYPYHLHFEMLNGGKAQDPLLFYNLEDLGLKFRTSANCYYNREKTNYAYKDYIEKNVLT